MRFFARFISLILLVAAVMAAVLDAIQSVAASQMALTPLGVALLSVNENLPGIIEDTVTTHMPGWVWDPLLVIILQQPAFAVFLALSLAFWMIGYRRPEPSGLSAV